MENRNQIFIKNLRHYLNANQKTQTEVAAAINVPISTFSTWMLGKAFPRMGKVQALADYFNCSISDLIMDKSEIEVKYILSADEKNLIDLYRHYGDKNKLLQIVRVLCSEEINESN